MIVALCLSPLDVAQGLELLKLWADLEDSFNSAITVAICLRFDMAFHRDIPDSLIAYVAKKFNILTHVSRRKAVGWPAGCNGLELDAYEWFVQSNRSKTFDIEYIMLAEADTVPLRKGWANEIMNEAYDAKASMLGCLLMRPDCGCEHINGNCVFHRDFWMKCKNVFNCSSRVGWDAALGPYAVSLGTASRLIWQDYRLGLPENPWKGDAFLFEPKFYKSDRTPLYGKTIRPAFFHGIKTLEGIKAVRRVVLGEKID
jgi:hypothetical protein